MVLKKIVSTLLVIFAGAMFPTVFFVAVVAALHVMDRATLSILIFPLGFALWGVGWFVMRRLAQHD